MLSSCTTTLVQHRSKDIVSDSRRAVKTWSWDTNTSPKYLLEGTLIWWLKPNKNISIYNLDKAATCLIPALEMYANWNNIRSNADCLLLGIIWMSSSPHSGLTMFVTLIVNSQVKEFIRNNMIKSRESDKKMFPFCFYNSSTLRIVFNFPQRMLIHNRLRGKCSAAAPFTPLTVWQITLWGHRGGGGGLLFIMSTEAVRNDLPALGAHYYKENWSGYIVCIAANWSWWCLHCLRFEPATLAFSERTIPWT